MTTHRIKVKYGNGEVFLNSARTPKEASVYHVAPSGSNQVVSPNDINWSVRYEAYWAKMRRKITEQFLERLQKHKNKVRLDLDGVTNKFLIYVEAYNYKPECDIAKHPPSILNFQGCLPPPLT